ncbi:MAG: hypothetical protein V3R85_02415 [Alphaproteobacteria bacterium]
MEIGTLLALLMLSPVVGVVWGWLVYALSNRSIIPDDGTIIRLPCPWERDGMSCWRQWVLLHELKGTIIILIVASINAGSPPILLLAFGLIVEAIKYGEKVRPPIPDGLVRLPPPSPGSRL